MGHAAPILEGVAFQLVDQFQLLNDYPCIHVCMQGMEELVEVAKVSVCTGASWGVLPALSRRFRGMFSACLMCLSGPRHPDRGADCRLAQGAAEQAAENPSVAPAAVGAAGSFQGAAADRLRDPGDASGR